MTTEQKLNTLWNLLTEYKYSDWIPQPEYLEKKQISRETLYNWLGKNKVVKINIDGKNYIAESKNYFKNLKIKN